SGRYGADAEPLKDWVRDGGTLVLTGSAVKWAIEDSLVHVDLIEADPDSTFEPRAYASLDQDRGAQHIGGAIFSAEVDHTHPLGFGYDGGPLPVFHRGTVFMAPADNSYGTPLRYSTEPLLSGYISDTHAPLIEGAASVIVTAVGKGRVVLVADELAFRAFWFGTNKIIANAVFFGALVDRAAAVIER
ncbi:MAG: zinc carboxypeptidase, partial [Candidatus Latescibacterota bacterium]|nr:zinc carboxypeptidase [Candidatus Latescibacterota bacterium]